MSTLLICTESSLPPNVHGKTRGYLEIEVTKINFITSYTEATTAPTERFIAKSQRNQNCCGAISIKTTTTNTTPIGSQGASARFTWWGECSDTASSIRIVRAAAKGATLNGFHHHNNNNKSKNNNKKEGINSCLQQQQQQQLKCSKVRYSIQTCLRLFLEYLQTCEPLEISVSTNVSNLPLGRAQVRLPTVFVRKFAANYTGASNFEHKSKIYALYATQHGRNSHKCGELQLKFKIMFAPSAKQMLQEQLQSTLKKELQLDVSDGKIQEESSSVNNKFANADSLRKSSKTDEIVEAMKKIDAKLVAYLAGEDIKPKEETLTLERLQCASPISQMVGEMVQARFREQQLKIYQRVNTLKMHLEALTLQPAGTKYMELLEEDIKPIFTVESQLSHELIKDVPRYDMFHVMQFESGQFQSLTQCTRFAQDAQREIHLRHKQTTTSVEDVNKNNVELQLNFGKLNFIVWWRQPGTCLNEMLGMAVFDLEELYQASLLEQCKCLAIKRRDVHLANLYFKISFQLRRNSNGEVKMLKELRENSVVKEFYVGVADVFDADDEQSTKKQPADVKEAKNMENTVARGGDKPSNKSADAKKASNNNNSQVGTLEFTAETTKVRLLKGYIYANETRHLPEAKTRNYYLVCRRFWHSEASAIAMQAAADKTAKSDDLGNFKYQEQFAVLNDELFLHRVEKQFLQLEIWQKNNADNGNTMEPYGLVRLPLHQYFIAYRDAAITNHLCKGKLPVISIDAWAPIMSYETNEIAGEIKCLLAIGSEAQIEHLKDSRSLMRPSDALAIVGDSAVKLATLFSNEPLEHPAAVAKQLKLKLAQIMTGGSGGSGGGSPAKTSSDATNSNLTKRKNTAELLDMLQSALMTPPAAPLAAPKIPIASAAAALHVLPAQPLQQLNQKCFKLSLNILGAKNLPLNPLVKGGKKGSAKRNSAAAAMNMSAKQNRFPPNEPPSVYVTFQADECGQGKLYKSHEGMVYATNIVEKTTQPVWQQRFGIAVTMDYLNNPQKRFILKVWKKAATDLAQCRLQPTPMEDAILGFAAIDLSVFLRGLHIGGWFNVVDFNGRVIGQLELQCQPIDDVQKLLQSPQPSPLTAGMETSAASMNNFIDQFEKSLELSHLNLGQAIKRKYSDLEQISQRLRTRLADVTGVQMKPNYDLNKLEHDLNALPLADDAEFAELEEFEQDLNTPPQLDEDEVVVAKVIATIDSKAASPPCAPRQPDSQ